MINTEHEYWLLDELITMTDRKIAQQAMSLVWNAYGRLNQDMWNKLVEAVQDETCEGWRARLKVIVEEEMNKRGVVPYSIKDYTHKCGVTEDYLHGFRPL